ncbi:Sperm-tail PG-rich repeat-containing protein 2 [Phlyctochytrium bullatum]|nr:Sperm-tail PG-rich repeat-containing protein 2 [Phlyctochytrium bullatum]
MPKPFLFKPQPFGSTTSRFDSSYESKIRQLPAPGSYELDALDSIISKIQKKTNQFSFTKPKPFGSITERFSRRMPPQAFDPGPGAYDVEKPLPRPKQGKGKRRQNGLGTAKFGMAVSRGDSAENKDGGGPGRRPRTRRVVIKLGDVLVDPTKVRIPAFGTQTERFHGEKGAAAVPPPGAYQIADSFEAVKKKGRIPNPSLSSNMPRELFPSLPKGPGPGEYEISKDHVDKADVKHGAFLSTEQRFAAKQEPVPGPGTYLSPKYDNGLVKKTFNITLRDWRNETAAH